MSDKMFRYVVLFSFICTLLTFVFFFINGGLALLSFTCAIISHCYWVSDARKALKKESQNNKEIINKLIADNNLNVDKEFYFENHSNGIVLDISSSKIGIIEELELHIFPFSSILSSEISEDDVSITKTLRGSQIGGAIVGGVLAGGIGAAIGSMSGKKINQKEVKKIYLNIIIDDLNKPIHTIKFLNKNISINKETDEYKEAYNNAFNWYKTLDVIINRQDKQVNSNS